MTGNEDGAHACAESTLFNMTHLGCVVPPNADTYWVGEAGPGPSYLDADGPEHPYTQRTSSWCAHNLLHMARIIDDHPIPPIGNTLEEHGGDAVAPAVAAGSTQLACAVVMPTIGLLGDVMLGRAVGRAVGGGRRPRMSGRPRSASCAAPAISWSATSSAASPVGGEPTARVPGKPFFFRAPPQAIESLEAIGVGAVGLANNHALDYETEALIDTLELFDAAGIAVAGAGRDGCGAPGGVVDAADARVGLVAVADHPPQFAAGRSRPGIAHADLGRRIPDWLVAELGPLREECDLVIAFPHWGPNMATEPARLAAPGRRAMQEAGADLVAGHSAHVFHGVGWSAAGRCSSTSVMRSTTMRSTTGCETTSVCWLSGGPVDPDAELELVGLDARLLPNPARRWRGRGLDREAAGHACGELGTQVERTCRATLPGPTHLTGLRARLGWCRLRPRAPGSPADRTPRSPPPGRPRRCPPPSRG